MKLSSFLLLGLLCVGLSDAKLLRKTKEAVDPSRVVTAESQESQVNTTSHLVVNPEEGTGHHNHMRFKRVITKADKLSRKKGNAKQSGFYAKHLAAMQRLLKDETDVLDWGENFQDWFSAFDAKRTIEFVAGGDFPDVAKNWKNKYDFVKGDLCMVAKVMRKNSRKPFKKGGPSSFPHVLLANIHDKNMGAFSSSIDGKTKKGVDVEAEWTKKGCDKEMILQYLNHGDTLAVFTIQHHTVDHEKIISIPIGIEGKNTAALFKELSKRGRHIGLHGDIIMANYHEKRGAGNRAPLMEKITKKFGDTVLNKYNKYGKDMDCMTAKDWGGSQIACYYQQMRSSRFVLAPSGEGLETSRIWEALYLGVIPVLERDPAVAEDNWWLHTFSDLPVAWVDSYAQDLSHDVLNEEIIRLLHLKGSDDYHWEKLTKNYWIKKAQTFVDAHKKIMGSNDGNGDKAAKKK